MTTNRRLAGVYHKFLTGIDWQDSLLVAGLKEGRRKFLSNAFLSLFPKTNKYHCTHYVSANAIDQLRQDNYDALAFEHLVPKTEYIQVPCQKLAAHGNLSVDFVEDLLDRYWHLATVTDSEHKRLHGRRMPKDWDGICHLARYKMIKLDLIPNPYFPKNAVL